MVDKTIIKPKPLHHQFEDELGELVDRYLLEGVDIARLKGVLLYEADYDHFERYQELKRKERS